MIVAIPAAAPALIIGLDRGDIERILKLTTWPRTDADRARFHEPYIFDVGDAGLLERIEIITEARRLLLIAEDHARAGDQMFARGTRDAEEALKPWRGVVSILARVRFDPANPLVGGEAYTVAIADVAAKDVQRTTRWSLGEPAAIVGWDIEGRFAATGIGPTSRDVRVLRKGVEQARVRVDFSKLD